MSASQLLQSTFLLMLQAHISLHMKSHRILCLTWWHVVVSVHLCRPSLLSGPWTQAALGVRSSTRLVAVIPCDLGWLLYRWRLMMMSSIRMGTSRALLDNFEGIGGHTQAQPLKQPPPSAPSCISMLYDGHSVPGMLA